MITPNLGLITRRGPFAFSEENDGSSTFDIDANFEKIDAAALAPAPPATTNIITLPVDTTGASVAARTFVQVPQTDSGDGIGVSPAVLNLYPILGMALDDGAPGDTIRIQISGFATAKGTAIGAGNLVQPDSSAPGLGSQGSLGDPQPPGGGQFFAGMALTDLDGNNDFKMIIAPFSAPPADDPLSQGVYSSISTSVNLTQGDPVCLDPLINGGNSLRKCRAADVPLGVAAANALANNPARVIHFGVTTSHTSGPFAIGDRLAVDDNSLLYAPGSPSGLRTIGIAIDASDAPDIIKFIVMPGTY